MIEVNWSSIVYLFGNSNIYLSSENNNINLSNRQGSRLLNWYHVTILLALYSSQVSNVLNKTFPRVTLGLFLASMKSLIEYFSNPIKCFHVRDQSLISSFQDYARGSVMALMLHSLDRTIPDGNCPTCRAILRQSGKEKEGGHRSVTVLSGLLHSGGVQPGSSLRARESPCPAVYK